MRSGKNETFDFSSRNNNSETSHGGGESSSDTFGIAYKPFMPKKNRYELPKGPAFEDEVEFERELKKSSIVAATTLSAITTGTQFQTSSESDDEFDFEEVDANAPRVPFKLPTFDRGSDENIDETVSGDNLTLLSEENETSRSNEEPKTLVEDFRESSKKALAEIKDVYSSGLGDHEIVLLQAAEDKDKNCTLSSDAIMLDMTQGSAIEEIDEEEFERQEEEAEQLEKEKATNDMMRLERLQSQWDNVGIEKDSFDQGYNFDDKDFEIVKYSEVETFFR